MKRALILGGGIGGVVAANILKKKAVPSMRVMLVDRELYHFYTSSYPRMIIGERKPEDIIVPLKNLETKGIEFIRSEVKELDLPGYRVITDHGDITYDYLVISLGVEYHPEMIPGFREFALNAYDYQDAIKINERLKSFSTGKIVLFISSLPFKCPLAPYEIMLFLDQFFRRRGIRHKVKLSVVTPEHTPEPLAPDKVGLKVRKMLAQKGIQVISQAKVLQVEKDNLGLDLNVGIQADLLLGIAPHRTPQAIRTTDMVDKNGYINVDPFTLETKYKGVYAIGDAAAIRLPVMGAYAPKAGVFAHAQAKIVAQNIVLMAQGEKPDYYYDGKGFCIVNTGFGKGCYSAIQYYRKPGPRITFMRPTKAASMVKAAFEKYWLKSWF